MTPYDSCMATKLVNGKQLTVASHVNDLKASHQELEVLKGFAKSLNDEFGQETPITESYGKQHEYLGMKLDFAHRGEVMVTMVDYIKLILQDVPEDMKRGTAATPAGNHLFKVNEIDPEELCTEKAEVFVHIVMQLLYLSQRARPDIRTAVSFLCSRLNKPDQDDYKKLSRVVKYLRGTLDLPLRLSGDGTGTIRWWIDASFGVHVDMKGHTGGTLSLGRGSVYSTSTKQKLVARSSTESEVIGVHDVMPQVIWTNYFLQAQGVKVGDTVVYQDNMSSILLEKNGRSSSSKRTRHMNIRYFFVKDRVASNEIRIDYCPTEDMIADFFTKPLQGKQFYKLRDCVMNVDPSSKYHSDHRSVLKPEVVEKSDTEDTNAEESITELMNKLDGGAQVRTQDTVNGSGANEIHTVRRSYKDVVMNGGELSR